MMVCGVLGPRSNAHGPNEFLHVPIARRLAAAGAQVMAANISAKVSINTISKRKYIVKISTCSM